MFVEFLFLKEYMFLKVRGDLTIVALCYCRLEELVAAVYYICLHVECVDELVHCDAEVSL